MTRSTANLWRALGNVSLSSATETGTEEPIHYWLPGWGFKPEIFENYYSQIPGIHFGLDYAALFEHLENGRDEPTFDQAVELIQENSESMANWIGWSLGGALAAAVTATQNAHSLVTLATGCKFLADSDHSEFGMPTKTFEAFCQQFDKSPAKTLKRFSLLCAQGSEDPRTLASKLSEYQLSEDLASELATSLQWLTEYQLDEDLSQNAQNTLALYGSSDALNPGGLQPARSFGNSHAFLLEQSGMFTEQLSRLLSGRQDADIQKNSNA